VSPDCSECGYADTTLVVDTPRWETRAGIERYECLRCGAETRIEPEPPVWGHAPAP